MTYADPIVSIIVATLNAASTLPACLDSIRSQTYVSKEVTIIDGGSTDGTQSVVGRYGDLVADWVSEPDHGIYDAWNKGVERSSGEWICFLGADDSFAAPDVLAKLVELASDRGEVDLVHGKSRVYDAQGRLKRIHGADWEWRTFKRAMGVIAHPGALHHRVVFDRLGKFKTRFRIAGDYEFLLRAGPGLRTAFLDEVVVDMGGGGVSNSRALAAMAEAYRVQRLCSDISDCQALFYLLRNTFRYVGGRIKHTWRHAEVPTPRW